MNFLRQFPSPEFSHVVKYYWWLELTEGDVPSSHLSFPYGAFELIFFLKNPNTMRWLRGVEFFEPRSLYAGQLTQPYILNYQQPCICAGISLQPWAGNILFNIPADEFKDEVTAIADFADEGMMDDAIMSCTSVQCVFTCFEEFVAKKGRGNNIDLVVKMLAEQMINYPFAGSVDKKMNTIGLGRRRIEQRFKKSCGLTMGMFLKKVRFQHAIKKMEELDRLDMLKDVAFDLGYCDQSHFNHDFHRFTGISPGAYLQRPSDFKNFLQSLTNPSINAD